MEVPTPTRILIRFGVFEVDLQAGELRKSGAKVRLQQLPLQLLGILVRHPGSVVTRQELCDQLWPNGVHVDFDRSLNKSMVKLREALGDSADSPRFIETLPKVGYRFISPINEDVAPTPAHAAIEGASKRSTRRWRVVLPSAVGVAAVMAAVWLLNPAGLRDRVQGNGTTGPIRSLAVLPLENLSRDPDQEYFADGMTDELISDLSQISPLRVISRTSVMRYKKVRKPLRDIGKELNVDAVVEGTVEVSGGRVRISAQLIQASTDSHLWSRSYERDLRDVLTLQDELARAIAEEVRAKLDPKATVRLAGRQPVVPEAYEAYLQGLYQLNKRTHEGLEKSTAYFERAVSLDPNYAVAYAGLADSYALRASLLYMSSPPREMMPRSKAAARKALEIDNNLSDAHAILAYVGTLYDWDWANSRQEFQRAIELNPNNGQAHVWYAMYLAAVGRHEESVAEVTRAQELDPLSLVVNSTAGLMLYFAGNYDTAVKQYHNVLEFDPNFFIARWQLGLVYEQRGMYAEALSEFQKAQALSPENADVLESIGEIYSLTGHKREALEILHQLTRRSQQEFVSPYALGELNLVLGDKDPAFEWFEKAYTERDNNLIFLRVDPLARTLADDARYQSLIRRMGFPGD